MIHQGRSEPWIWGFPRTGVPLLLIHFNGMFHDKPLKISKADQGQLRNSESPKPKTLKTVPRLLRTQEVYALAAQVISLYIYTYNNNNLLVKIGLGRYGIPYESSSTCSGVNKVPCIFIDQWEFGTSMMIHKQQDFGVPDTTKSISYTFKITSSSISSASLTKSMISKININ